LTSTAADAAEVAAAASLNAGHLPPHPITGPPDSAVWLIISSAYRPLSAFKTQEMTGMLKHGTYVICFMFISD